MDNENILKRSIYRCIPTLRRHAVFFTSIAVLAILGVVFYHTVRNHIPKTMDVEEWRNVTQLWVKHGDQRISLNRMVIVTGLFIPQMLVGAPFLNITKVLTGYWFGWVYGLIICIILETVLGFTSAFIFLRIINRESMESDIAPYLKDSHGWLNLFLLHMSSMPMHIKITLLTCHHISPFKFWSTSLGVSGLMSLKNVIIGNLLYYNKYVWIALSLALILSVMPMVIFIYLMISNGVYSSILDFMLCRKRDDPPKDSEKDGIFSIESDTDSVNDVDTWKVDGSF